jgi:crossover junction endodeoxyribonuclease RuvC
VDASLGQQPRLVHVAVIRTPADNPLEHRLLQIDAALATVIDTFQPDAMAVERVFSQHNLRSVMGTAQVAGLGLLAAARRNIPIGMHTPTEVKAAVTGSGRADKEQVTTMVTKLLRLDARPTHPLRASRRLGTQRLCRMAGSHARQTGCGIVRVGR